jgi:hypothetical protein
MGLINDFIFWIMFNGPGFVNSSQLASLNFGSSNLLYGETNSNNSLFAQSTDQNPHNKHKIKIEDY